jgi:hypothetical protein
MTKIIKMMSVFALVLSAVVFANAQAQTTGTVQFDVSVQPAFDLRNDGPATASPGVVVNVQTANGALGTTITINDASPNVNNATLTASAPIRMRSNATYKLTALRANTDSPSATDFEDSDIKMGITYTTRSGANVNTPGLDAAVSGWGASPTKTVGDLTNFAQKIAGGDRISNGGNNVSTDNFVRASLNFSVARAYYTPINNYTETVSLAIVAGP